MSCLVLPVFGGGVVGYCSVDVSMPRVASDEIGVCDVEASVCLRPVGGQRPLVSTKTQPHRQGEREREVGNDVFERAMLCTHYMPSNITRRIWHASVLFEMQVLETIVVVLTSIIVEVWPGLSCEELFRNHNSGANA